jgi:hypothetical protein
VARTLFCHQPCYLLARASRIPSLFYERDCQGRTLPSLIAYAAYPPWQSAPDGWECETSRFLGWAGQSSSASSSSLCSGSTVGRMQACGSRLGEPWFYLRLGRWGRPDAFSGSAGGPMVRRVPRRDCWPGERLRTRLPPAPWSRISEPRARRTPHTPGPLIRDASALASSASLDRSVLLSSKVVGSVRRAYG